MTGQGDDAPADRVPGQPAAEELTPREKALLEKYTGKRAPNWKKQTARRLAEQAAGYYAERRDPLDVEREQSEKQVSPPPASHSPESEDPSTSAGE
ncbi:MAG: hypothetical protein ACKVU1_11650 [bacterium]